MLFWFGFVIIFTVSTLIALIPDLINGVSFHKNNGWVPAAFVGPIMIVFGILLVNLCDYLARDEDKFLTDFIIKTLDAHIINPGDQISQ